MKNPNRIRKTAEDYAVNVICIVFGVLLALACIYPIYYTLINSLNEGTDAAKGGIYLWPRVFSLKNYEVVFRDNDLPLSFLLTVVRTLLGTVLALVYTTAVSYALSRRELIGRKFYLMTGMVTMYVSGGVIPTYMLYRLLGLVNSFWVYILPSMYSFGNAILMLNFFKKLPDSLIESAKIDGAQEFTILFKVILPLSKPLLATIALFVGVGHWNDWFAPAYFVTNKKLMTMPATLMRLLSENTALQKMKEVNSAVSGVTATLETVRYATLIVSIAPITILYPFLQKYFIQGMMVGALKE